jgi:preprotein translocase subunit SecE
MRFNWKVAAGAIVIIAVMVLAFSITRSTSYSGSNLNFSVSGGPVTVTNPSGDVIPVQLVGSGARNFAVSTSIDGVAGNSTRDGSGSSATQTFLFDLPAGVSEFTVARGNAVQFVAVTDTVLEAVSSPMSSDQMRTTLIIAAVVVLAALFYMSNATGHQWLNTLRGRPQLVTVPAVDLTEGQGRATRSYGDNRSEQ